MTSVQAGISCDYCKKNNFRGLRYKCLVCYDFDLCSTCYEAGLICSRHNVNHAMQCIVAKDDFELFYAGESIQSDRPQSLTCPLCGTLGFDETTLIEHVNNDHPNSDNDESSTGTICPICGAESNQLTFDFATHLTMEHRSQRDTLEQVGLRGRGRSCLVRTRGRRSQAHQNALAGGAGSSPSSTRDSADPLVEMLAQLSGVRRPGGSSNQSPASQLHQLQMHIQSSPSFSPRSTDVRIMRRTLQSMNNQLNGTSVSTSNAANGPGASIYSNVNTHYCSNQPYVLMDQSSIGTGMMSSASNTGSGFSNGVSHSAALQNHSENPSIQNQFLLPKSMKPVLSESEQQEKEILKADRSLFVQELLVQIGLLMHEDK